ncbi:prepilin-type N-terminal cleavage/methylation domain-containing protein [Candidatus Sumerlaeota bacterium]|nr:prepilin-type N-terminal cleavage/methylation domain-containing protein [Candidatus Sumerlaeota bacterium]
MQSYHRSRRAVPTRFRASRAFTLVETMIAAAILVIVAAASISSIVFGVRATRVNTNSIVAKNIAQGYFERMNTDTFANVGPANYPDISSAPANPADTIWLDQALDMPCAVDIEFKGFGRATAASAATLTDADKIATGGGAWVEDEWVGSRLYLVDGQGIGQYRTISANSANVLTVSPGFDFPPAASTGYMIDNGKTVRVTTSWEYMGKTYSRTIGSLIINYRNDDALGF